MLGMGTRTARPAAVDLAGAFLGVGAESKPGAESVRGPPAGHVGANFGKKNEAGVRSDPRNAGEVNAGDLIQILLDVECRGIPLTLFTPGESLVGKGEGRPFSSGQLE